MIRNILANDNIEDYYSESRSDNDFEEQTSAQDDDQDSDSDDDDSELDHSYKFSNSPIRQSSKEFWERKTSLGTWVEGGSSKRVLRVMGSLLAEIKEEYKS